MYYSFRFTVYIEVNLMQEKNIFQGKLLLYYILTLRLVYFNFRLDSIDWISIGLAGIDFLRYGMIDEIHSMDSIDYKID